MQRQRWWVASIINQQEISAPAHASAAPKKQSWTCEAAACLAERHSLSSPPSERSEFREKFQLTTVMPTVCNADLFARLQA